MAERGRVGSQIDSVREHKPLKSDSHRFCVAPMMEWTDRHCRYFLRLISRRTFLYTEMVTADAVLYGNRERVLGFSPEEHPVGLQLGGSDAAKLAEAARIGADYGYDEINLNIGCPSDRVQSGRFGACLMAEPDLVAECVAAMGERAPGSRSPSSAASASTTRTRRRASTGSSTWWREPGCRHLHRACAQSLAQGPEPQGEPRRAAARLRPRLSLEAAPARSRDRAQWRDRARSLSATAHLPHVDGVMLGRAAYADPYLLAEVDRELFGANETPPSRLDVLDALRALCRGRACARRAAQSDDAAYSWAVPRPAPRARLPPASRRERPSRRRGDRGAAGGAAHRGGRGAHRAVAAE